LLGPTGARRIDTLVHDLVETSEPAGDIVQSRAVGAAMSSLRSFMFERVYLGPQTREQHDQARAVVQRIFAHLAGRGDDPRAIVDYLSGMTDRFALSFAERLD
jgi:dGTPase